MLKKGDDIYGKELDESLKYMDLARIEQEHLIEQIYMLKPYRKINNIFIINKLYNFYNLVMSDKKKKAIKLFNSWLKIIEYEDNYPRWIYEYIKE